MYNGDMMAASSSHPRRNTRIVLEDRFVSAAAKKGFTERADFIQHVKDSHAGEPSKRWIEQVWSTKGKSGDGKAKSWTTISAVVEILGVTPEWLTDPAVNEPCAGAPLIRSRVRRAVRAARASQNAKQARDELRAALAACEQVPVNPSAAELAETAVCKARVLAELAADNGSANGRTALWLDALRPLDEYREPPEPDIEAALLYATISTDFAQDTLCTATAKMKNSKLAAAKDSIDSVLRETLDDDARSLLLAKKAALLREQSLVATVELPWKRRVESRRSYLDESIRCTKAARDILDTPVVTLQCGLSYWALARNEYCTSSREGLLNQAEGELIRAAVYSTESALLSLARFYRLTWRPLEACKVFEQLSRQRWRTRMTLRGSFIYGEAVDQLYYRDTLPSERDRHLDTACGVLLEAVAAGCASARTIVALAHVRARIEGPEAGKTELVRLRVDNGQLDWDVVIGLVTDGSSSDELSQAFALGLADSGVYCSIARFLYEHLQQSKKAKALLEAALTLDPRSDIALKLLAEIFVSEGEFERARTVAAQAENFAPPVRRQWARQLKESIDVSLQSKRGQATDGGRKGGQFRGLK